MFLTSLLAPALILTSGPVLAQKALIDTVPDFYFVEAPESAGETLLVHACQDGKQKRTWLNGDLLADNITEHITLGCIPIEVTRADLDQFLRDLSAVLASPEEEENYENYRAKKFLVPFGLIGFGGGAILATISTIMHSLEVKHPPLSSRTSFITAIISIPLVIFSGLGVDSLLEGNRYATNQRLVRQIRAGLVYDENKNTDQRFAMEAFTEFLNTHGRRPETNKTE